MHIATHAWSEKMHESHITITICNYNICDPEWENKAFVHIEFDHIFGVWNSITSCLNIAYQKKLMLLVQQRMGNSVSLIELT